MACSVTMHCCCGSPLCLQPAQQQAMVITREQPNGVPQQQAVVQHHSSDTDMTKTQTGPNIRTGSGQETDRKLTGSELETV